MREFYVLGSLNMDLVTNLKQLPKRGETISSDKFFMNSGGKGANQAVAIAKQGYCPFLIGSVGEDTFGSSLKNQMERYGVNTQYLSTKESNTGLAIILVENGDNRIILSGGANQQVTFGDIDIGLSNAKKGDFFITQLENNISMVEYGINLAHQKEMYVIFNPAPVHPFNLELYSKVDLLIVNETEASTLSEVKEINETNFLAIYNYFAMYGLKNLIITLGSRGAVFINADLVPIIFPAINISPVDTTAAGDTFVGVLATALADSDFDYSSSIKKAIAASALTCLKPGAQQSIPTKEECINFGHY